MMIDDWIKRDLEKSGLNIADFPVIPLRSKEQLQKILGFKTIGNTSILGIGGYFIPYPLQKEYFRLKLRYPIGDAKYLSPKGSPNYPYMTKRVYDHAKEYHPDDPLTFTEGEKKAAKGNKEGFLTIGLAGVWNFKSSDNDFLPQLENLNLKYRKGFIGHDSDIVKKISVKQAELRLAVNLINRGATPHSIRFPAGEKGEKIGLDDFLVKYGKEEYKELMVKAKPTFLQHLLEDTPFELIIAEALLITSEIERERITKEIAKYRKIPIQSLRNDIKKKVPSRTSKEITSEEYTQEEKMAAQQILESTDILEQMLKITEASGYVGEEINKRMLYFSFISRMSDNAISCIVKGASASGKSTLVQSVLNLFPKEDILKYSYITSKALVHSKLDLSHKILFIQERTGAEQADYSIRTVISEEEISILIPIKNNASNNFETVEKRIPAKSMVYVETTTKDQVHDENQTRVFDLYMDESEKQTGLVLIAEAKNIDNNKIEKDTRIWRCLQQLLKPYQVYIPFSQELAKKFPKKKIRVRRDFKRFLALIKAHALLYQFQREIKDNQIIVTNEDLTAILPLAEKVLMQSMKDISPKQEKVLRIIEENFENSEFSSKELFEKVKDEISLRTVKYYLKRLDSLGLIEWNGKKGTESRYNLSTTLALLPDTYFSPLKGLSDMDFILGNAILPNVALLPNTTIKNEEAEARLGNEAEWGNNDLPNQMVNKANQNNGFSEVSDSLGNQAKNIEEENVVGSKANSRSEPMLLPDGSLNIPFDSDPKYHWWENGRSITSILEEIKTKKAILEKGVVSNE
jgi:hypothetical protein